MSTVLRQLVYVSHTTDDFDFERDKTRIQESSTKNNPGLEVTGVLFYKGGIFLQYIEGSPESIDALYERRIKRDPRHTHVKTILDAPIAERLFWEWDMKFADLDKIDVDMVNSVLEWHQAMEHSETGTPLEKEKVLEMIRELRRIVSE